MLAVTEWVNESAVARVRCVAVMFEKSALVDSSTAYVAPCCETAVHVTLYGTPVSVTGGTATVGVHVGTSRLLKA